MNSCNNMNNNNCNCLNEFNSVNNYNVCDNETLSLENIDDTDINNKKR